MGSVLSAARERVASTSLDWILPANLQLDARTCLVFGVSLLLGYFFLGRSRRKLPPGPVAFPVVGNMPQLAGIKNVAKYMMTLREKYGDVVRIKLGSMTMFLVFGPKLIRDTMINKGHSVVNRPNWIYIIKELFQKRGVFWSNGDVWKNLRKITVVALKDFGVGKRTLEERIQEECSILGDEWEKQKGKAFLVKPFLADAVSNIMCAIVFGERFEYGDPQFRILLGYFDYLFRNAGIQVPENFFPWARFIRGDTPAKKMIDNDRKIQEFVIKKIDEHRVDFDPDQLRDFIDVFLKTEQDEGNAKVTAEDAFRVTVDLFLAGSEATSTVLQWFFLFLVAFPDVQEKCWDEIKKVVDHGRSVGLADKERLTYILAVLHETLRVGSVAPLAPPHSVVSPVEIGGYKLEPNDIIIFHIASCHTDSDYWDEPEKFRPERWLDKDGKLIKHQAYLPFGLGPRTCIGEPLVFMEAFLFATNLIERFEFRLPAGAPRPKLEGQQDGVTNRPEDVYIQAIPRN